ncbi:hypothetical protein DLM45_07440 [Hyphomicrobium methylovorum]|nr:hypothetical protein [Hyphomicrobium methylovorum]
MAVMEAVLAICPIRSFALPVEADVRQKFHTERQCRTLAFKPNSSQHFVVLDAYHRYQDPKIELGVQGIAGSWAYEILD